MPLINQSHLITSLAIVCSLIALSAWHSSPSHYAGRLQEDVSSTSAVIGATPRRTRVYNTPAVQPSSLIWKTGKLFVTDRSYQTVVTFEGIPGNQLTSVSTPSGQGFSELLHAQGTIYFSLYINDGYVYAQHSETGKDKWRFKVKRARLSPVAVGYGMVYVGASDGTFYALDATTGEQIWKRNQKGRGFYNPPPMISEGVVYFSSTEEPFDFNVRPDGRIFAFDAKTGDQLWVFKTKGALSAVANDSKTLFVGDSEGYLRALDAITGQERLKVKLSGGGLGLPIIEADSVYVRSGDGNLHAVDARSGKERWKTQRSKAGTMLALYDGSIYYGGEKGNLFAVDAETGQEKWLYKTSKPCQSPVVAGGVLYFPSYDGVMYSLDAKTGEEKWKLNDLNKTVSPPVIADGVLYFLDGDGHLYAVK